MIKTQKIHVRRPGIEPGSQEWESCMIPLHQRRLPIECNDFALLLINNLSRQFLCRDDPNLAPMFTPVNAAARLAQSVEHETLNLRVVGSSPTLGEKFFSRVYFTHVGYGYLHLLRHPGAVA